MTTSKLIVAGDVGGARLLAQGEIAASQKQDWPLHSNESPRPFLRFAAMLVSNRRRLAVSDFHFPASLMPRTGKTLSTPPEKFADADAALGNVASLFQEEK